MAKTAAASGKDRYRARFLTELDDRIAAILAAAEVLRASGLTTIPDDEDDGASRLVEASDEMYRHAHSIRGAAGTLGIEPAREAADILVEVILHLGEEGMLGDAVAWDLMMRAVDGLKAVGVACATGEIGDALACPEWLSGLRADFEGRFAAPTGAGDDLAEVARMLRLSDEEIAAFGFPTAGSGRPTAASPAPVPASAPVPAAVPLSDGVVPATAPPIADETGDTDDGEIATQVGSREEHAADKAADTDATEDTDANAVEVLQIPTASVTEEATGDVRETARPIVAGAAAEPPDEPEMIDSPDETPNPAYRIRRVGSAAMADGVAAERSAAMADAEAVAEAVALIPNTPRVSRVGAIFCESGLRMLEQVPPALDTLDANRWDTAAMRTVRRAFHTIKGDGKQIGFDELATLAEAAEDTCDAVFTARERDGNVAYGLPAEALPLLRQAHAALVDLFRDPLRLAQGVGDRLAPLTRDLLDVADLAGTAASLPPKPAHSAAEERRRRLFPAFLAESRQLVDVLHGHIGALRADPANIASLLAATRALHTLKGNAMSMAMPAIADLAHGGESLLEGLTLTAEPVAPAQLNVLNDLDGALRHIIDTLDHGEDYDAAVISPLLAALNAAHLDKDTAGGVRAAEQTVAPVPVPTPTLPAAVAPRPEQTPHPVEADAVSIESVQLAPRQARSSPWLAALSASGTAGPTPSSSTVGPAQAHGSTTMAPGPEGAAKPLFMPRSSSVAARARTQRRSLTENITSVDLGEVERAVDLFGQLVTARTMIARGVEDLGRPATESLRNSQRLRRVIDKLATEFEAVRRERRLFSQRDGWDELELENFDASTQIMLELNEIIADQEEIAGGLSDEVRRTALLCEGDLETTNRLQHTLLGFRLVRLSSIEPRLDQVISSTARAVGKTVDWTLRGGEIAMDKVILDAVQEPLLHLLRNAIDHGFERTEDRVAAGKNPAGAITVAASYGVNSATITVGDDGAGIDPEHIAATAVRRGVLSAAEAAALDAQGKIDLIWRPGFSTATTVTDISGRGVGLDIVRGAIERVRGTVTLQSVRGRGTTFTLSVPLSLSVVRTLLLHDGEAMVAAPIAQIEGVHVVSSPDVTRLGDRTVASIGGRTVTLLDAGLAQPVTLAERLTGESIVVLEVRVSADRTVGFAIDEVLGEEDTLVKGLPRYLRHHTTFVGCSVAGNGRPYAIVDLRQLAEQSGDAGAGTGAGSRSSSTGPRATAGRPQPLVLVVDDSLFMRRSLTEVYQGGGFRVETAEDGEEALAAIARIGLPDLISVDMEMPRMNGLEMVSVLRQLPGGHAVPVFMVTTRGQDRHRGEALKAGVSRYFIKPFDGEEMLAAARSACTSIAADSIA